MISACPASSIATLPCRGPMPSLLDNLQRRLDDLPVPDVLHRALSSGLQEPAAGLEASPSLRVRAFPPQPQGLQPSGHAPAGGQASSWRPGLREAGAVPRLQLSHRLPDRQVVSARQPHIALRPTWDSHAEPPAVRQAAHSLILLYMSLSMLLQLITGMFRCESCSR